MPEPEKGSARSRAPRRAGLARLGPIGGSAARRTTKGHRIAGIAIAILLAVATALAAVSPARALTVELSEMEGRLHWAYQGSVLQSHTSADGKHYTLWWVLEDSKGRQVDELTLNGSEWKAPSGRPSGQDSGIWTSTSVRADVVQDPGGGLSWSALTLADVAAAKPDRSAYPELLDSWIDLSATETVAETNNGLGFAIGHTAGQDTETPEGSSDPTSGTDWIRGYATGETDGSGNVVTGDENALGNATKPEFDLFDFWGSITRCLVNFFYCWIIAPVILFCTDVCEWLLGCIDPTALLAQDFNGGSFVELYRIARQVSDSVAVPYGTAFLGVVFVLGLVDPSRTRNRIATDQWVDQTLTRLIGLLVAWTAVVHALDLLYWIYWLGSNLAEYVTALLVGAGYQVGGDALGTAVSSVMTKYVAELDYNHFGAAFLWLFAAIFLLVNVWNCVSKVLSVCLLRMAEIYLRASFAAIPFSFFASDGTRQIGVNYLKRFAAVCFQAAIIVVTLSFMGLIYQVTNTVIVSVMPPTSDILTAGIAAVLPLFVAIAVATSVVEKSEPIANGLFGLA